MSFFVLLDPLPFQLERIFEVSISHIDKLLPIGSLTIELAKARGQIDILAHVRIW